jgi:hypothetical protein
VPEVQARFLGRSDQEQILYTFDLNRWDDGSKLECLTQVSPLVRRLQDYAIMRGATLIAHVPSHSRIGYQSYLLARFSAQILSSTSRELTRWLGVNLTTGSALNVKGDPMATPGLIEGLPPGQTLANVAYGRVPHALQVLADQWNDMVRLETDGLYEENQRLFKAQAQQVYEATTGTERERAIQHLRSQHEITTECELSMALVLILPVRTG